MSKHPDHSANLNRIRRIKGQLDGIERMIIDGRYCPDILTQTSAVASALRGLERRLLERHLAHCVTNAFEGDNQEEREKKMSELLQIFEKRLVK